MPHILNFHTMHGSDKATLKACLQEAACGVQAAYADFDFDVGRGKNNSTNKSGDCQNTLDITADTAVEAALRKCPLVAGFCSEEREGFVSTNPKGKYIVMYDPLDGSQNIGVGISVGCIFGVHQGSKLEDLHNGRRMVAAAYAVHSATMLFTFSWMKDRPSMERYNFKDQTWNMVKKTIKIPHKGKTYCINEGNIRKWDPLTRKFIGKLKETGRSTRWSACMVSDVHRPLLKGGMFAYPIDSKHTKGRLRLVYENYSMAYLWEAAGGKAIASVNPRRKTYKLILDTPFPHKNIHARGGVVLLGPHEFDVFTNVLKSMPAMVGGAESDNESASEWEDSLVRVPRVDFSLPLPFIPRSKM